MVHNKCHMSAKSPNKKWMEAFSQVFLNPAVETICKFYPDYKCSFGGNTSCYLVCLLMFGPCTIVFSTPYTVKTLLLPYFGMLQDKQHLVFQKCKKKVCHSLNIPFVIIKSTSGVLYNMQQTQSKHRKFLTHKLQCK